MAEREKRSLGYLLGLERFAVISPSWRREPRLRCAITHSAQDECIYVLEGHPTLINDEGETRLTPGMFAGFKAGDGNAHH